jgi:hypothetical protein
MDTARGIMWERSRVMFSNKCTVTDLLKALLGNASVNMFLRLCNNRQSGVFSLPRRAMLSRTAHR